MIFGLIGCAILVATVHFQLKTEWRIDWPGGVL
ncbi:MAG: hypothetical protein CEN91_369 [Candidatus Berkelbacteria bacterium Licking1014_85]|uniref:Uncharacterized protein n=1 Tax=Candidatus Berkelbacteria bacterium Licking1014_85 TaxID=2017148 RepID=A0A554LJH9_9BACT|nr:MAG: hypothetical protein CEN91_369 [Candidatus Berkelbacteria bacterium Licking1014_85]